MMNLLRASAQTSAIRELISRRLILAVVGAAMALTSIGCSSSPPGVSHAVDSVSKSEVVLQGAGTLTSPDPTSRAITYNPAVAPIGAMVTATFNRLTDSTVAELAVSGLLPNRGYAVHAHTKTCGVTGDAAGPHFQNRLDPAATPQAPSTNPDYANPSNEIWLDVRTDAEGTGMSRTTVPFTFTDRAPASIVVHEAMTTATHPGHAGTAGSRIACLTLSGR
jgi:superoxide dismutase, Cu-Zn family